ncbi:MAG: hypothetical protein AAGK97_14410, partial [Bacteroidota bacterium]
MNRFKVMASLLALLIIGIGCSPKVATDTVQTEKVEKIEQAVKEKSLPIDMVKSQALPFDDNVRFGRLSKGSAWLFTMSIGKDF